MIAPRQYTEQDRKSHQRTEDHMDLVRRIAWHFSGRIGHFAEIEELMQAGYQGLVDASHRYTVQEGVSFAAYAAIRIRGSIVDLLRKNSNLCRSTIEMRRKIKQGQASLEQKLGRTPEPEELAEALGMGLDELHEQNALAQANQHQSLDEVYTDQSLLFAQPSEAIEDVIESREMKNFLRDALGQIPEREALVLQLYYVEELNVYEVGAILGVSTGRVSQIKKSAITKLRKIIEDRVKK